MIIGIGSDLVDIRRIERTIERFGGRFLERVFTEVEQARSDPRRDRPASYARRFAAKEACAKALGTGLGMGLGTGATWREMAVDNLPCGKPTISLCGGAAVRLARLVPPGFRAHIALTIADDYPLAQAFVVISALPAGWPDPDRPVPEPG